ncbi:RNA-dependent RNA polymerase [Fusarium solani virus 1]|uniref:RNA-dependent RNA polymerase n=1 Tax=Fusarium solani virus 1 TaxID=1511847 RepID=Q83328_9VIRU|nr:RNA-dependent RNA polymerase [Fusarium solani virus 1]BAA09520.1 RNA-dependent RNA polymerase [Fusarium solani virus 1]
MVELFVMVDPTTKRRRIQSTLGPFLSVPGLQEIARYGGYATYRAVRNTDPWIRQSLKLFDPDLYGNIYGFTRRPAGPEGMYKSLMKFGESMPRFTDMSTVQRSAMKTAITAARKRFKTPVKFEPLEWSEVGQHMRRDTSAGVSFPGKKKGDVMERIYAEGRWLGHRMKQGGKGRFDPRKVRMPPCLATQRGHLSPRDDPKTRLAWIYPSEMLMVEGLYAPTMYKAFEAMPDSPLLLGKGSHRLFSEWVSAATPGMRLYGLDFSSFDTKVPAWLIHTAFDILHDNIDWLHWRGKPTTKRSRQKWKNVWDGMVYYFINTPILMPDGRMFRKRRGVPSGSWWTQLVDSVVNWILVKYLSLCQGVNAKNLRVLGDDSAFMAAETMDLSVAAEDAAAVGMDLSDEKSISVEDATELKLLGVRYRDGHAFRETEEWFKLALYPEGDVPDIATSLTRLVGLWIGGAMWDTKFSRFMEYFQGCYPCPSEGWFSKDQRRWMEIVHGGRAPRGWTKNKNLFWRSIFYTL